MTHTDPYKTDRKAQSAGMVDKILGRKSGGRVKDDDGDTNIHIEVNAAPKEEQDAGIPPAPPMAPPPPPMMPPLGGPPPPMGGLGGGGGGPLGLKSGGAVKKNWGGARTGRPTPAPTTRSAGAPQPVPTRRPTGGDGSGRAFQGGGKGTGLLNGGNPAASRQALGAAMGMMPGRKSGGAVDTGKPGVVDQGGAGGGTGRLEKTQDARRGKRGS